MALILTCYNHPTTAATATCADCGAGICAACTHTLSGQPFCVADYAIMRREPSFEPLVTAVPPYQPSRLYQTPIPYPGLPIANAPLPPIADELDSIMPPDFLKPPAHNHPEQKVTRWVWVELVFTVIAVALYCDAFYTHLLERWIYSNDNLYFVSVFSGVGIFGGAVVLLRQRSDQRLLAILSFCALIINGFIFIKAGFLAFLLFAAAQAFRGLS